MTPHFLKWSFGPKIESVDGICQQTDSRNRFYLDVKTGPNDFRTSRCAAYLLDHSGDERLLFKKNLNASKPSEHPPSGEKMSKGLGGNIGCRDKTSSWYQTGSPM